MAIWKNPIYGKPFKEVKLPIIMPKKASGKITWKFIGRNARKALLAR